MKETRFACVEENTSASKAMHDKDQSLSMHYVNSNNIIECRNGELFRNAN